MAKTPVRILVVVLAALAAGGPAQDASAADARAAAFRKSAGAAMKSLKATVGAKFRQLGTDLKAAAAGYAAGTSDPDDLLRDAVTAVSTQRAAVLDAALEAMDTLGQQGSDLLADAPDGTVPGKDFLPGGRGTWDRTLRDVEKVVDKADLDFDAAMGKLARDVRKSAARRDRAIDLRWRVPPHGDAFWIVDGPNDRPKSLARPKELDRGVRQVLIAARILETTGVDYLSLGVYAGLGDAAVSAQPLGGATTALGTIPVGPSGFAVGEFSLAGLTPPSRPIRVDVAIDAAQTAVVALLLSMPNLVGIDPAAVAVLSDFKKRANKELAYFRPQSAKTVAEFIRKLASHVAAVRKKAATPDLAIATGCGNLRDARNALLNLNASTQTAAVTHAATALAGVGVTDATLPFGFAPDGGGDASALAAKFASALAGKQALVTKSFESFIGQIEGLAKAQQTTLDVRPVLGRDGPDGMPLVMLAVAPSIVPTDDPRFTDVMLVQTDVGGLATRAEYVIQTDPSVVTSSQISFFTRAGGETPLNTLVNFPAGGAAKDKTPLLGDVPFLSYLFKAGKASNDRRGLIVVVTPRILEN
jgi:hypothetical protein